MTSIPSNIARVPNILSTRLYGSTLTRTNLDLLSVQGKLATHKDVNRASDDPVRAGAILALEERLERHEQRLQNLDAADNTLNLLDTSLADASDLLLEAKSIASGQIGATGDAETRRNQAVVIDASIRALFAIANRETGGLHIFAGSETGRPPLEELAIGGGAFRYRASGSGLVTDLGLGDAIPVTLGGANAIGETSTRIRSQVDLNPALTGSTRLVDLNGARNLGITLGVTSFSFDGGSSVDVDLAGAETIQDVIDTLTAAIRQYETDNAVTILGSAGIGMSGGSLSFDIVPAGSGPDPQLVFADAPGGVTGADLGLIAAPLEAGNPLAGDVDPKVTLLTDVSALSPSGGLTLPMDSIRIRFSRGSVSSAYVVDLSSAQTLDDVRNLIEQAAPGVRVRINAAGNGIDVLSELSGPRMSIEEVAGGADTATELGIRSLAANTSVTDFNEGRGVRIVTGATNPTTGLPDPARDADFQITLGDGSSFVVDLRPQDLATVQSILDRINSEAAAAVTAGQIPPASFSAGLTDIANGIALFDTGGLGPMTVKKLNNSAAAEDLGLLNGAFDASSAVLVAQDRAGVRINNLLTSLMDLRDALSSNNSPGISLAGEGLEESVDRLASARALVGVYSQRISRAAERQEDVKILDERVRSTLQDLDYADASIRFNLLQTQLQAALSSIASTRNLSLVNFLT